MMYFFVPGSNCFSLFETEGTIIFSKSSYIPAAIQTKNRTSNNDTGKLRSMRHQDGQRLSKLYFNTYDMLERLYGGYLPHLLTNPVLFPAPYMVLEVAPAIIPEQRAWSKL